MKLKIFNAKRLWKSASFVKSGIEKCQLATVVQTAAWVGAHALVADQTGLQTGLEAENCEWENRENGGK